MIDARAISYFSGQSAQNGRKISSYPVDVRGSFPRKGRGILPVAIYFTMSWPGLIALNSLLQALPLEGVVLVVTGAVFYTAGIVFYALDYRLRHAHGIWHLFVLAGSVTHYIAAVSYVA